ncbi:MAG: Dyp-type peroxidase [Mobilicoccus sp.]|nr:Dyp-type peroxidase [Mobilicoccus sp.]
MTRHVTRRTLLRGGGVALAGSALSAAALSARADETMPDEEPVAGPGAKGEPGSPALHGTLTEPFHGEHQSGVATAQQAHAVFLGLDLADGVDRTDVRRLMRLLSDDAARMTQGRPPLAATTDEIPTTPGRLTVTFGFGPGLFDAIGRPEDCPEFVREMPAFSTDRLEEAWGQTDLLVQVCSEDPVTVTYAHRRLARDAAAYTSVRWVQRGFTVGRGTEPEGTTPRNLMGMRDGSGNESDPDQVATVVWNDGSTHPWLAGGSQMVVRRMPIDMAAWDDVSDEMKEIAFGRRIGSGAPLNGEKESDVLDRFATDDQGFLMVEPNSHGALSQARSGPERMIRRSYNYVADTGEEGLVFVSFQADLGTAFVPVQTRLAESDALNAWTFTQGSAAYAIPPGASEGSYIGSGLLEG